MNEGETELLLAVGHVVAAFDALGVEYLVSDRQWRDLLGVLKVQARTLDRGYLTEWACKLGLADLLERALGQADPG